MSRSFRILSLDGGGIRGVFSAHLLKCIQDKLGYNLFDEFDLIAGTSTGSIIAAGIACKIEPSKILDLYKNRATDIFIKKKHWLPSKGFRSAYSSNGLQQALSEVLGDLTLGEVTKPLIIPATNIGEGIVHVFKSKYSDGFIRDPEVLVRDAVLASCSAPTFFDPKQLECYLLSDGGLWANNPTLVAYTDAQKRLNINPGEIKILSIGTGHSKTCYGSNPKRNWGLLNGWRNKEFIAFLLSLQAQSVNNTMNLLLEPGQILRLDFESDLPLPLDDVSRITDLQAKADIEFTYKADKIRDFFNPSTRT